MTVAMKTKVDLGQLRSREAELAEQVEATRGRLSEYSTLIADARREAVYAGKARPGGELGGSVRTLTDKERKDATALIGLEGDLSAIRSVIAEEAARLAEEETAEARARLAKLHDHEEAVWKRGGELFGELAGVWNELVEIIETEDRFAQANGLDAASSLAVTPAPASFKAWLLLLHQASTDAEVRAEPFTEQLIDSGTFRTEHGGVVYDVRPAGTRQVEVRRKLDYADRLHDLIPDLRSIVHKLRLGGRVPTITSE